MTTVRTDPVPQSIITLPGVQQAVSTGTVARATPAELSAEVSRATDKNAAAEKMSGMRREEFKKDLIANATLVNALSHLHVKPTPEGLDRVSIAAISHPAAFREVIATANVAALTLGKSQGAMTAMTDAMTNFSNAANVRATDQADMAYLMARVVLLAQQTEREQTVKAIDAALAQAKAQLEDLEKQRAEQAESGGKVEFHGKMVSMESLQKQAEMPGAKGAAARARIEEIQSSKSSLDAKIAGLKDTIAALEKAKNSQSQANQELLNAVIFALVEKAITNANAPRAGTRPPSGTAPVTA
jgi:hypothetical protein